MTKSFVFMDWISVSNNAILLREFYIETCENYIYSRCVIMVLQKSSDCLTCLGLFRVLRFLTMLFCKHSGQT